MPQWDASDLHYPNYTYIIDSFREGRIPFWDPYTKSGGPFHAEPYQPILNPLIAIIALLPIGTYLGFVLFWLAHWWIAGIGMIWLASLFGASPLGALIAAFGFCFSGFFVGHSSHMTFIVSISWIPWIFSFASLGISRLNFGYFLLAGFALGMSSMGGYPPLVAFTGLALGLWLILLYPKSWGRILVGLSISGFILTLIYLPTLHAFITEGVGHTSRNDALSSEVANFGNPFAPTAAFSFIFPFAAFITRGWYDADITMADAYCGILAVPFIFYWWFKGERKKPFWWLAFFLFMLAVSLGGRAGLRIVLYYIFPPLRYIRFSSQFRAYWILALALATGLGFTRFSRDFVEKRDETLAWIKNFFKKYLLFIVLVAIGLIVFQTVHGQKVWLLGTFLPAAIILPLAIYTLKSVKNISIALLVLFIADMVIHVHVNHGSVWDTGNKIAEIAKQHRAETTVIGEPGGRKEQKDITHFSEIQVKKDPNIWGFTAMILKDYSDLVISEYASVLKSPHRFWLSPSVRKNTTHDEELEILFKSNIKNPVPVFLEPSTTIQESIPQEVIPGTFGEVKILLYAPEKIEMSVEVPGQQNVALVSTERWGKSWRAQVDGVDTPVYTANLLFRGLVLKPGHHLITWVYQPPHWYFLAFLSLSTLFLSLGFGLFTTMRTMIPTMPNQRSG